MMRLAALILSVWTALWAVQARSEALYVEGAQGVPLAVSAYGDPANPGILFLHGLGHGRASFSKQWTSDLQEDFYIAGFDLRGHGQSGKPSRKKGYAKPAVWAGDVRNVLAAIGMQKPIMVAWSYGGLVAADYIRTFGADSISGLVLVSSLGGMVTYQPDFTRGGEEMAEAYRLLGQPTLASQARAVEIIAPFLTANAPPAAWAAEVQMLGMMLPPYVRPLLAAHHTDNLDLPPKITVPLLIAYGGQDPAIPAAAAQKLADAVPSGRLVAFKGSGHSPFVEEAEAFNALIRNFAQQTMKEPTP